MKRARIRLSASHGSLTSRNAQRPRPPQLLTAGAHRSVAVATFGYVGWDSALWDANLQLLLHLFAIGAIVLVAFVFTIRPRKSAG